MNKERQVATNLARAVVVNDKYYLSVSLAGAAEGLSEKTVRKYIKTKLNWNYFDKLTDKQKKEIPDLNETIRVSKKKGYKLGQRVWVDNQVFSSILKTSKAFNVDSRTVRKISRSLETSGIESPNFVNWKWLDDCTL